MSKIIPYGKQWIDKKDIQKVIRVLRGAWITQGPAVSAFEQKFAKTVKSPWAVAVSSGTAGLHLAVLTQNLKPNDEVLVPAITFVATANAVFYAGAKPRLVDVDPKTGNICVRDLERKINENTRGIIPVHFSGNPVELNKIRMIAQRHKLFVIEDCCHALGAEYAGQPVGSSRYSDLSVFSFHPVKHITTGEGGMITGKSKSLSAQLLKLRNHGITRDAQLFVNGESGGWYYEQQELGFNYRITDFQCALGMSQLEKLKQFLNLRRAIVKRYQEAFQEWPEIECLEENPDGKSAWHLFVVLLNPNYLKADRKKIFEALRAKGIGVQVHYIPLHFHPYYQEQLKYKRGDLPGAESFYERAISLPLYPQLSLKDQQYVIQTLRNILTQYQKRS